MTTGTREFAGPPSAGGRIAVVAGTGKLPVQVAETLAAQGNAPLLIVVGGEAVERELLAGFEQVELKLEHVGDLVPLLKRRGVGSVVFAGGVTRRPRLARLRWNFGLLLIARDVLQALARGDNDLLRTLIRHVESAGIRVVGAHEIVPDVLAEAGAMTRAKPVASDHKDIEAGFAAARAIGLLDIGQAAVAIAGRVIALEGIEGTDGLLARVAPLRGHGRLAQASRGVLVKCMKPQQEERIDLPAIGPSTVEAAHAAGLAGIAVEAGRSLILDQARTIALADELGLFIVGWTGQGGA